MTAVLLY